MKYFWGFLAALAMMGSSVGRAHGEMPVRICALSLQHLQAFDLPLLRAQKEWVDQEPAAIYGRFHTLFEHWVAIAHFGQPLSASAITAIRTKERVAHLDAREVGLTYLNKLRMKWVGLERLMRALAVKDLEVRFFSEGFSEKQRMFLFGALGAADGINWWVRRDPSERNVSNLARVYQVGYALDSKEKVDTLFEVAAAAEGMTTLMDASPLVQQLVAVGFSPEGATNVVKFARINYQSNYQLENTPSCCNMSCADCPAGFPYRQLNKYLKDSNRPRTPQTGSVSIAHRTPPADVSLQDAEPLTETQLELYQGN